MAASNQSPAILSTARAELDEVIGICNHVRMMLDEQDGVTGVAQTEQGGEEFVDISEMQAGGGFVENQELGAGRGERGRSEQLAEFQALGFATGEGVGGLSELEITEAEFLHGLEDVMKLGDGPEEGSCIAGREF